MMTVWWTRIGTKRLRVGMTTARRFGMTPRCHPDPGLRVGGGISASQADEIPRLRLGMTMLRLPVQRRAGGRRDGESRPPANRQPPIQSLRPATDPSGAFPPAMRTSRCLLLRATATLLLLAASRLAAAQAGLLFPQDDLRDRLLRA